jgi:DNA polymerase-1
VTGQEEKRQDQSRKRFFLIDGMSHIFRSFYAIRNLTNSQGLPTNAIYGFINMLKKLIKNYQPDYLAIAFDSRKPTFRHEVYEAYKANRTEMPDDLALQLPYIRRLCEALRIPILEKERYEADDIIGTLATRARQEHLETVIVSNDKDMFQLVGGEVKVLHQAKEDTVFDSEKVKEFFGVPPEQVVDVLGLMGDSSDNIPGAPGIGEKGARDLIHRFGSLDRLLAESHQVERKTYRESLENHRDQILKSKELATIETNMPLEARWEDLRVSKPDGVALRELFTELGFQSMLKDFEPEKAGGATRLPAAEEPMEPARDGADLLVHAINCADPGLFCFLELPPAGSPASARGLFGCEGKDKQTGQWRSWQSELDPSRETQESNLRDFWERESLPKIFHQAKAAVVGLRQYGIALGGICHDTMLMSYLLQPNRSNHNFEEIVFALLGENAAPESAGKARQIRLLYAQLSPKLAEARLRKVYEEIELPLIEVLAEMELAGIRIDRKVLCRLSAEMEKQIASLTGRIYELAGQEFNINSPRQLGEILFEKLNLPAPKRLKKSGQYSTAVEVLEQLAQDFELPRHMLEYRQLSKLKSGYVDSLPELVNPRTGRVHTSFNQTITATGRLSSSNPNLQNIPVRTELGMKIRSAFVPEEGWHLVSADYSQIELRVLAHFSADPVLIDSFRKGEDIHARTAMEVFGIHRSLLTPELRRRAKAINFGIVFGQTAFGLAKELEVPNRDAQKFIQLYFERYQGVKNWIEETIAETRRTQLSRTLSGRLRQIPDIASKNPTLRGFAERTAINSPVQGTAADLIKLAMIRIQSILLKQKLRSRLLLQVHDELVLEVPGEERELVCRMVKEEMEQVMELSVPITVGVGIGPNWMEAK